MHGPEMTGAAMIGPASIRVSAGSGRSLTSVSLGEFAAIFRSVEQVIDLDVGAPHDQKRDAQQQANQHIAPKRFESQTKAMNNDVAADEADIFVLSSQKDTPGPERLQRNHRRVNGHDRAQDITEEIEEIDLGHGDE